jgi:hypothetical protein
MKQVAYLGASNISHHRKKFSRHGEVAPVICALLQQAMKLQSVFLLEGLKTELLKHD